MVKNNNIFSGGNNLKKGIVFTTIFFLIRVILFSQPCDTMQQLNLPQQVCFNGTPVLLNASSYFDSYQWQDGSTDSTYLVTMPGIYYCKVIKFSDNLIYNGDFEEGDTGFNSDYTDVTGGGSSALFPEATYAIGNNPHAYHPNFSWCTDHTGFNGNMLIGNGAPDTTDNVWCQTVIISPHTDYIFSTWLTSVNPENPATLVFTVNGSVVGQPFTSSGDTCTWEQFYEIWNSGDATVATICIRNRNNIYEGNDFAIDDIFFGAICTQVDTVYVVPVPTSDFESDSILCYGDVVTATYTGNPQNAVLHWDYSLPSYIHNTGNSVNIAFSTPGANYISLYTEYQGCYSDTTVHNYNVPGPLDAILTIEEPKCFGSDDGSITAIATGGTSPYNFTWNTGAVGETLPNIPAGTYQVTITDAHGCHVVKTVTVEQPDRLNVNIYGPETACNGENITELASATGGTPPYSYVWSTGDTYSSTTFSITEETTVSVTVTDANGCVDSVQTTITVSPPLHIDLLTNRDTVCKGDKVIVSVEFQGGAGAPYETTDIYGNDIEPPVIMTITKDTTIIWRASDVCGSTDVDTINIYIYPMPEVHISSDTISGCQPLTVHFNANSGNDDLTEYIWNFGDNDYANLSLSPNPEHLYTDYGVFTVTLYYTTADGCKDTVSVPEMITVYKKPKAEFDYKPEVVTILNPVVDFINLSEDNVVNFWSFGDGDSSIQVNPRHVYPSEVYNYPVTLIIETEFGCKDTAVAIVEVQDINAFFAPTAYTPDNDGVNDLFCVFIRNIDTTKDFSLSVYDRWGELIWQTDKYDPYNPARYGWDGTAKGGTKKVPPDVYVWLCKYFSKDGNSHIKNGTVTVIY